MLTEDDVMAVNEGLVKRVFQEVLGVDVATPFRRMPYSEAMARFGSDKPDTRFGLELQDVTDVLRDSGFAVFKSAVEAGGSVRAHQRKGPVPARSPARRSTSWWTWPRPTVPRALPTRA